MEMDVVKIFFLCQTETRVLELKVKYFLSCFANLCKTNFLFFLKTIFFLLWLVYDILRLSLLPEQLDPKL